MGVAYYLVVIGLLLVVNLTSLYKINQLLTIVSTVTDRAIPVFTSVKNIHMCVDTGGLSHDHYMLTEFLNYHIHLGILDFTLHGGTNTTYLDQIVKYYQNFGVFIEYKDDMTEWDCFMNVAFDPGVTHYISLTPRHYIDRDFLGHPNSAVPVYKFFKINGNESVVMSHLVREKSESGKLFFIHLGKTFKERISTVKTHFTRESFPLCKPCIVAYYSGVESQNSSHVFDGTYQQYIDKYHRSRLEIEDLDPGASVS
jgi:hypothetical protein